MDCKSILADNMSIAGTLKGNNILIRKHEVWNLSIIKCNRLEIYGKLDTKNEDALLNVNELINYIFNRFNKCKKYYY